MWSGHSNLKLVVWESNRVLPRLQIKAGSQALAEDTGGLIMAVIEVFFILLVAATFGFAFNFENVE